MYAISISLVKLYLEHALDGTSDQYALPLPSTTMKVLFLTSYASFTKACLRDACSIVEYEVEKSMYQNAWLLKNTCCELLVIQ